MFKNKKVLLGFILGVFVTSIISVGAVSLIYSKDVTYDNSISGLKATTVQGALDELYESAKNGGAKVSCNDNGECTVTCKQGNPIMTDSGYSCETKVTCPNEQVFLKKTGGYKCAASFGPIDITENAIKTGDGLYKDAVTDGRYFYRGSDVNNYITFNNEMGRIISIESDGTLKIVRNEQLPETYRWDAAGNRNVGLSTYCKSATNMGCDAWVATNNLLNISNNFIQYYPNGNTSDSTIYSGTVTKDSTMATYLNGEYYNSLPNEVQNKIVKGTFNVSTPGDWNDTESLETDAKQEKQYQWKGYVALYTVTELLRASTNSNCVSLSSGYNDRNYGGFCSESNWLWQGFNKDNYEWTLSPCVNSGRSVVWNVIKNGYVSSSQAYGLDAIRPVLHLSADIKLWGAGSSSDPYQIVS